MKPPDYRFRMTHETVSVQHRVKTPSWEVWLMGAAFSLIIHLNRGFNVLWDSVRAGQWDSVCGMLLLFCAFLSLFGWSWLNYSSGEFTHCDARGMQTGRRRFWTRWRRRTFTTKTVSKLRLARRGGSKTRNYSVLTFGAAGKQIDSLEDIASEDALRVLLACKVFGFDCVLPEVFRNYDGPMNADIAERGWLVNPWRPTRDEEHPKEQ